MSYTPLDPATMTPEQVAEMVTAVKRLRAVVGEYEGVVAFPRYIMVMWEEWHEFCDDTGGHWEPGDAVTDTNPGPLPEALVKKTAKQRASEQKAQDRQDRAEARAEAKADRDAAEDQ